MIKRVLTQVKRVKVFSPEKRYYIGMSGNDYIDFEELVYFDKVYQNDSQIAKLLDEANKFFNKHCADTWRPAPMVEVYWKTLIENTIIE